MKKLALLVATSILGLSSVAAAKPAIDLHAHASVDVKLGTPSPLAQVVPYIIRDHREPGRWYRPAPTRPAPPMSATKLGTVSTGKQTLRLAQGMRLDSLVLQIDGIVELKQVLVTFANGQTQLAKFGHTYTGRMASPVVNLAGSDRQVKSLTIYTTRSARGEISVFGRNDNLVPVDPFTRWAKLGAVATGKQVLKLDERGRFDRLAMTASGRVHVKQVLIRFADGTEQLAKLDVVLVQGSKAPIIELAGTDRRIKSLIVYTADDQRGELTLYAI